MILHSGILPLAVSMRLQDTSAHDMLDASMFWAGLFMVLTPLVIIGSVVGFVLWKRRADRREPPVA